MHALRSTLQNFLAQHHQRLHTPHLKMTSEEIAPPPRFDFFQTATQVIVSVYVKGCSQDDIQLDTKSQSLRLTIHAPKKSNLEISPLFGEIDTSNSAVTTLPSKVEISLQKLQPGIQWPSLQGSSAGGSSSSSTTTAATAGTTTASISETTSSRRSKWDSFKDVEEEEEKQNKSSGNGTGSEGSIDDFFKQLYANADDDTRKAMMKSYQESGGTALSTNWEDVKKGKVKTEPPKGMEARKW